jgi:hypothetical protein
MIIAKTTKAERLKAYEEYKKLEVLEEERSKIHVPIFVGSTLEEGARDDGLSVCNEIEQLSAFAHRLQRVAYRKEAEELLEKRGGEGNVEAISEELRLERIKGYQKKLDEEESIYQRIIKERETDKKKIDVIKTEQ